MVINILIILKLWVQACTPQICAGDRRLLCVCSAVEWLYYVCNNVAFCLAETSECGKPDTDTSTIPIINHWSDTLHHTCRGAVYRMLEYNTDSNWGGLVLGLPWFTWFTSCSSSLMKHITRQWKYMITLDAILRMQSPRCPQPTQSLFTP